MTYARTQLDWDTAEPAALSAETMDCRCMTREYPRVDPAGSVPSPVEIKNGVTSC